MSNMVQETKWLQGCVLIHINKELWDHWLSSVAYMFKSMTAFKLLHNMETLVCLLTYCNMSLSDRCLPVICHWYSCHEETNQICESVVSMLFFQMYKAIEKKKQMILEKKVILYMIPYGRIGIFLPTGGNKRIKLPVLWSWFLLIVNFVCRSPWNLGLREWNWQKWECPILQWA